MNTECNAVFTETGALCRKKTTATRLLPQYRSFLAEKLWTSVKKEISCAHKHNSSQNNNDVNLITHKLAKDNSIYHEEIEVSGLIYLPSLTLLSSICICIW